MNNKWLIENICVYQCSSVVKKMKKLLFEDLTYKIIGCAIEVHKYLGPGFLESVYEDALCYEFNREKLLFERQVFLDVKYKDVVFEKRFKADILVDNSVIVELKAQKCLTDVDEAQLLNYLKVTGLRVGLLFNFGGTKLEKMRRII
ncbi:MAG: GxxExxY protein [Nitrospirota bacterium]